MQKKYFLFIFFLTQHLFVFSQTQVLSDLLNDISKTKILAGNAVEENYHSLSTQTEFDKYLYNVITKESDTVNSIALEKENQIKGVLIACKGCNFYNSVVLTSNNHFLPHLAQSTRYDGIINFAKFKNNNGKSFSVGDENADNSIDYAAYSIGKGLFAVITFQKSLVSPVLFLLYNGATKEYIGMTTFKTLNNKKIADRGYIKKRDGWDAYNLKNKRPVFIVSMKETDILKGNLPKLDELENKQSKATRQELTKEKEIEFLSLMKTTYSQTLRNWLEDYNLVQNSKVIGTIFPKLIVLNK